MDDRRDPNRGPIELKHDITPKDLSQYDPTRDQAQEKNSRYKGYPEELMLRPKHPLNGSEDFNLSKPREKAGDETTPGFQYGTGERPQPSPRLKSGETLSRLRNEQMTASEGLNQYKYKVMNEMQQEQHEKAMDAKLMRDYNPWGKPGAGAPRYEEGTPQVRKEKFTEEDLKLDKKGNKMIWSSNVGDSWKTPEDYNPFGKPGGGAPRTDPASGKITTTVPGAAEIRFQENKAKQVVENQIRYMQDRQEGQKYLDDLTSQMKDRTKRESNDRVESLNADFVHMDQDPYGRPGAGAKNPSKQEREAMRALQNPEYPGQTYDPWGKGQGAPTRDPQGNVQRHKNADPNRGPHTVENPIQGSSIELGYEVGGGAPNRTNSGHLRTRAPITMSKNQYGKAHIKEEMPEQAASQNRNKYHFNAYDPFGRPGGGAPLRASDGGVYTQVHGRMREEGEGKGPMYERTGYSSGDPRRKQAAQQMYLHELQKEMKEQRENRESMELYRKAPVGELATIMRNSQVGKPKIDPYTGMYSMNQHNPSSDVTRHQTDERRLRSEHMRQYHDTLVNAAEERAAQRNWERERDKQEAGLHQQNFDGFWGRPGHGAPTTNAHKKPLDSMLYPASGPRPGYDYSKAPRESRSEDGVLRYPGRDQAEGNFVRQTQHSDHRNYFQVHENPSRPQMHRMTYDLPVPYATE